MRDGELIAQWMVVSAHKLALAHAQVGEVGRILPQPGPSTDVLFRFRTDRRRTGERVGRGGLFASEWEI
jgi:hypothetical protein